MKKLFLIVVSIVTLIGCRYNFSDRGTIFEKGIDRINVRALYNSINISSTEKDKNVIEMYWIKFHKSDEKIYINLFTFETCEVGQFIVLGPEHSDDRFVTEY